MKNECKYLVFPSESLNFALAFKQRAFSSAGLEHLPYKQRVGGSNPSTPTISCNSSKDCRILFLCKILIMSHWSPNPGIAGAKVQLSRETSVYYKTDSQAQNHGNRGFQAILYCQITQKIMQNCSKGAKLG